MQRAGPGEPGYPDGLRVLATQPALWLRGPVPSGPAVAVVGTRRADTAGRALASRIARAVVERGAAVVSGLAAGVDTAAQRATVDAGGRTWAVVGCGVDVAGSVEDAALAADILARGGSITSELPPGTPASPARLVARDRIQTALSDAVVVVQTDLASGTMHTARFALAQGRPLAAVTPPPAAGRRWRGNAVLCDPAGCDPSALHATGRVARLVAAKGPAADVVLPPDGDLGALWDVLGW